MIEFTSNILSLQLFLSYYNDHIDTMSVHTIDDANCVVYSPASSLQSQLQYHDMATLKPFLFKKCGFVVFIRASWYHHCSAIINGDNWHHSMFFMLPESRNGTAFPLTQATSFEVVITRVKHEIVCPQGDLKQLEVLEAYNKAHDDADKAIRADVIKVLQTPVLKDVIENDFSHGGGDCIPVSICTQLLNELTVAETQCQSSE
jgi:hypothetical protein